MPHVYTDRLKLADFLRSFGATSVRAGCRQVIEVLAIVIENAFRPDNGRSARLLPIHSWILASLCIGVQIVRLSLRANEETLWLESWTDHSTMRPHMPHPNLSGPRFAKPINAIATTGVLMLRSSQCESPLLTGLNEILASARENDAGRSPNAKGRNPTSPYSIQIFTAV